MLRNHSVKKYLLAIFMSLFTATFSIAQITGKLIDQDKNPIAYANVMLLNVSDAVLVKGTLTDEMGQFGLVSIPAGQYQVQISFIGFQDWKSAIFELKAGEEKVLETIELLPSAVALEGVEVKAQKMLVQQIKEGTVLNVQSSLLTRGSTALQVLERSPGVFIDRQDGNISLNGQAGVRIMLNGKVIRLSVNEIITMLSGMSADNIEKIELLTNPSAKYEADGGAGLINIVFKKDQNEGTNGSISLSAGYGWREKASSNISLNHRKADLNFYGSYAFTHDHSFLTWFGEGIQDIPILGGSSMVNFAFENDPKIQSHNINLGIDKTWSEQTDIGASVNLIRSSDKSNIINENSYLVYPDSFWQAQIGIQNHNQWNNLLSSAYLEHRIKNAGKLSVNADYLLFKNQNPTLANSQFFDRDESVIQPESEIFANHIRSTSETDIWIGVLKLDYEQQLNDALKWETGLKASWSETTNFGATLRQEDENWVEDIRFANANGMSEKIGAAYTSFDWQVNSSLSLSLGARYEYWDRQFEQAGINRKRGKLFPSLFVSKQFSDISRFNLSYTQRITRPDFNDLASYSRYNGPTSVFSGNPLLQPMLSNNLRLAYQYKSYNFALYFNNSDHPIARYQLVGNASSDLIIVAPQNVVFERNFGLQVNLNQEITSWWSMNLNITSEHRTFELEHTPKTVKESYFAANMNGSQRFQLPKDFALELSAWYLTPFYDGSRRHKAFGAINLGIQKQLPNNQGNLQFSITDLLKSTIIRSEFGALTPEVFDIQSKVEFQPEHAVARIFRLSYFRAFGNNELKVKQRKNGDSEERNRVRQE